MKTRLHITVIFLIVFGISIDYADGFVIRLIKELVQNNLVGASVSHQRYNISFDPDISEKRRSLFYEQHGFRAAKYIERIGLGTDGKEQERRLEQSARDEGRLNGEHVHNFP